MKNTKLKHFNKAFKNYENYLNKNGLKNSEKPDDKTKYFVWGLAVGFVMANTIFLILKHI